MKDKLGSAAEVNEFLKARTVLEKMRNEVEAKIKDDSLPIGTATTGPTGSSENAKPSGPTDAEKAAALLEKHKLDLEFTVITTNAILLVKAENSRTGAKAKSRPQTVQLDLVPDTSKPGHGMSLRKSLSLVLPSNIVCIH